MIPRIPLMPKDNDYPFKLTLRQFPVRLAFAMTINKSQGQTFRGRVGVFLPDPVFGHGQLYVAAPRVVHPDNIRFCILHKAPKMVERAEVEAPRGRGVSERDDEEAMLMEMDVAGVPQPPPPRASTVVPTRTRNVVYVEALA